MRLLAGHAGSLAYVAILITATLVPVTMFWTASSPSSTAHSMTPFSSYNEIQQFILTKSCNSSEVRGLYNPNPTTPQPALGQGDFIAGAGTSSSSIRTPIPSHSDTNVQVAGVDELDTVKNDGTYIYTVTNNTVAIVLAYPVSSARLVARVSVNGSLQGIFVEGNRLVVVSESVQYYPVPYVGGAQPWGIATTIYPTFSYPQTSSLSIFDISDRSNPVLKISLDVNGTLAGARLIGNYAYLVTSQPAHCNGPVFLPGNVINGRLEPMIPSEIYHSDIADYAHSFTTVVGIDISQSSPVPSAKSFLIGTSSNIYVSTDQIYLTQPIWTQTEQTAIYRISIKGTTINYEAAGTVQGHVLNQFSMDEYNGFFRIATSGYGPTPTISTGPATYSSRQQTNLYVLDSGLRITGLLEGLSPGEAFYAARFMADRAYLVTYQRMDPLFVIGLQDPSRPIVLGQLNITGVSDYLQPYDETHLIGLGKSSTNVTWENAALFQGLKLSLFDVTDPNHPIDTSNYLAGDRGSDSPALTDHKAVLFDQTLNLLVIPVEIAKAQQNSTYPWAYNPPVWQGAYVFNITIQNGIVFRGGITQLATGQLPSYQNSNLFITRALYIGNVLYTISNGIVMMNSLTDLSELGSVSLS